MSVTKNTSKSQKFFFQTQNLPRRKSFQDVRTKKNFTNHLTHPHVIHRLTEDFSKIFLKFYLPQILTKFLYNCVFFQTHKKREYQFHVKCWLIDEEMFFGKKETKEKISFLFLQHSESSFLP